MDTPHHHLWSCSLLRDGKGVKAFKVHNGTAPVPLIASTNWCTYFC